MKKKVVTTHEYLFCINEGENAPYNDHIISVFTEQGVTWSARTEDLTYHHSSEEEALRGLLIRLRRLVKELAEDLGDPQ